MHLCNSCTMLYCTLLYGIDLCSSCIHVCNSHENSYPAFLLLLHTTYVVYLLYFWCCHDSVYLWYLLFLVPHFAMCSIILCNIWSNHLSCRLSYIVFQIFQVYVKCYTVFIEFFYILMYDILLAHV